MIEYRKKNKDKCKVWRKRWHLKEQENPEKLKEWAKKYYLKHRKERILFAKTYQQKNKFAISKRCKERYPFVKNHKQKYLKDYYLKNRQKFIYRAKIRKYLFKKAGILTIPDIQKLYEDNIKKYGTLTCVYCEKPIVFGKDSIDHIIPLSKEGTNEYNNLAIACLGCNISKGTKSEKEYREWRKVLMLVS